VPPADDTTGEGFRGLVLRLRGRTGLTQRELAARVGVNVSSIQGWEAGANYPGVASLQALIAAGVQADGFTAGREREEAQALWAAALREAPRFRTPFDGAWFERVAAGRRGPVRDETDSAVAAPPSPPATTGGARRESWGEAPDIAGFLNRTSERQMIRQSVLDEGSRLVAVLGLGGIGKSLLATRLADDLAPSFERVFWRSLRDAPTPGEWLAEAIGFLAPDDPNPSRAESTQVRRLLELLSDARCLLVLDNFETVLQPGGRAGDYRPGYERYGALLRQVAEAPHRSCLVMTSREEPVELGPLRGEHGPVRIVALAGLPVEDGRALLSDKRLDGDAAAWQALVGHCGGNGLALKVVGETTRELFGGSIADFLAYATTTAGVMVGGVRELLGAQIERLSDLERELLRRLAVEREPVGLAELAADLGPRIGRAATLEAVEGLRRRSLLERIERGPLFGLHSVVLEYVTDEMVEDVANELASGEPDCLLRQPLVKATAKDYVRRSQERLLAGPILEQLVAIRGGARAAEQRLVSLLDEQRGRPVEDQGYGPGNIVNVLRLLRGDLKGIDLSGLAIRQAFLQDVEAQAASLARAHLSDTVLGEAFNYLTSLALSADGAHLVAGTVSGEVCRWRIADRTLLTTLPGHAGAVWGVALSGDGRLVASGGDDGTVRLWEAETGLPLATLHGHTGGVLSVALSGDGRLVASGSYDGTIRLWEAEGGRSLATLHGHSGGARVALSGDGRLGASGGVDGTVRVWEAEGGRPLATLRGHAGGVWGVAFSGDGRLVASGGVDGTLRLWDAEGGRPLATLRGHAGGVRGVALSGDGRLVAGGGFDGTVRVWDAEGGRPLATLHGQAGGVWGAALSGDGRLVASGGFDGMVRLWEAGSGQRLGILLGHTGGVRAVALSRDGRLVASGSVDQTVRLWEAGSGQPLGILHGHTGEVYAVALSGDGRLVASGGFDGTLRLWESATGEPLATLRGHTGGVRGVALSGDGRLVAGGGFDGTVRLWEAGTERPLATLHGHTGGVWGVALSGDGRLIASSGDDGTVRLWAPSTGACLRVLRDDRRYERVDITGLTGVTEAQRQVLLALGATERSDHTTTASY
jgi:WD40 repeat protein/transcriptional regulator with XRE-family HTH domain